MKRNSPEKTLVQEKVIRKLKTLMLTGEVLDFLRTPSFMAGSFRVGEPGRLDIMVVINQGNGCLAIMYCECKAPGKAYRFDKTLHKKVENYSYEQRRFVDGKAGIPKVLCCIIDDPKQLWPYIKEAKDL